MTIISKKTNKTAVAQQDIVHGKEVLAQEIKGLEALSAALDNNFANAVDLLMDVKGRIIVTGMGKSGHVARKIAATMASTGTPAHFVHPGEASHGDLGMIAADDAVLALSNSGETTELSNIVAYCRRFNILLIAMVRRGKSTLVQDADIALVLPETPEASPTGAPTTSTTMMMALGDALAMALLERKGFTKERFSELHPGGNLGRKLQRVSDLMRVSPYVPIVNDNAKMGDVLLEMTQKSLGCTGVVVSGEKLIGVITDGDLRRHMNDKLLKKTAREIMHSNPLTIRKNALAEEAVAIMNQHKVTSLFIVTNKGICEGIIHIHDCLRAGIA
jgi:arabinose-5-phosphate isomerase